MSVDSNALNINQPGIVIYSGGGSFITTNFATTGTWTPTISGSTSAGTGTYTLQTGYRTLLGNTSWLHCKVTWTAHTGTGNLLLSGLPATVKNQTNYEPTFSFRLDGAALPALSVSSSMQCILNTTTASFTGNTIAGVATAVALPAAGTLWVSFFYDF